jgi:hypothetical protein
MEFSTQLLDYLSFKNDLIKVDLAQVLQYIYIYICHRKTSNKVFVGSQFSNEIGVQN